MDKLSIPSHKSNPKKTRGAQEPQRSNGKLRVAAILEAASIVIAEKGYEGTTMAEIAARSGTKIGSLYRFFPNKEILADTLVVKARENLDAVFNAFDGQIGSLSIPALVDNLLSLMFELNNRPAIMKLLDASRNWSVKREEFRNTALQRIASSLMLYSPDLTEKSAGDIALLLLLNMKAVIALSQEAKNSCTGAINELREMMRLYLTGRLTRI
jgi:AcrR family transcriptional regulator